MFRYGRRQNKLPVFVS